MPNIIFKYRKILLSFVLFVIALPSFLICADKPKQHIPSFLISETDYLWADSIMSGLTLEEKISQLVMVAVYSNKTESYNRQMIQQVKDYQLGGIIFMQGGPKRQALLNNRLQEVSKVPLMIGFDGEWGLAMRLDSTMSFARAMAMGAISDNSLVYDAGTEIGRQCRRMGIHVNFAPVLDINSNSENPVINYRSFGENKFNVSQKAIAMTDGMQKEKVLAVGKHFPGHGDTDSDSHYTLPVVNNTYERMDSLEFYPFRELTKAGVGAMMVAHIAVPELIDDKKRPASLSKDVVTEILRKEIGFEGLVFTDALNMKGVNETFKPGDIEVEAIKAGNDILLFPLDIPLAISKITQAVVNGEISEQDIDNKCRKVLATKSWLKIQENCIVDTTNLYNDLHTPAAYKLKEELVQKSLTVVNGEGVIPVKNLVDTKIAYVSVGWEDDFEEISKYLNYYTKVDCYKILSEDDKSVFDTLLSYDKIIVGVSQKSNSAYRKYGIKAWEYQVTADLLLFDSAILALYGNPYALEYINEATKGKTVIVGYSSSLQVKLNIAQLIFGGVGYSGTMPVSVNEHLPEGSGDNFQKPIRLAYTSPEYFNLDANAFYKVDSIVEKAIADKAMPGCQILYVKEGKVIYNKTFGYHTYNENRKVSEFDLYDLASVTKVAASTVSLMKLYDKRAVDPFNKVSKYNSELVGTDKKNVKISEVLSHHGRLHPWIPFYKSTLDTAGMLRTDLFSQHETDSFRIKVVENLYMRNDYKDSVYKTLLDEPLNRRKKYLYSDLGYYWVPDVIKNVSGKSIDDFAMSEIYKPLGMNYTTFCPVEKFSYPQIVPTEVDNSFRQSVVHGFVNDQGAAMLGGVCGHAGLFSNANDLAKMCQMLLNEGSYGGERYFSSKTIKTFNKTHYAKKGNRRALGFDKPPLKAGDPGPTCKSASPQSFGHSGFTGTYFWVDPENESIYIFLSNRTFPDASNRKLIKDNIRTKIHQEFYNAFE